jgi:hypothetical protein
MLILYNGNIHVEYREDMTGSSPFIHPTNRRFFRISLARLRKILYQNMALKEVPLHTYHTPVQPVCAGAVNMPMNSVAFFSGGNTKPYPTSLSGS